jgi:RimJ/RimL family protein N-acetyltransferase
MIVAYSKMAAHTPAFALISEGWNDLVQEGLTSEWVGYSPVGFDNEVLYAVRGSGADAEIIGVLCYMVLKDVQNIHVTLGYVEPTSRGQGAYRAMWDALMARAKAAGIVKVVGVVHPANKAMQGVMQKLGRKLVGLTYGIDVGG